MRITKRRRTMSAISSSSSSEGEWEDVERLPGIKTTPKDENDDKRTAVEIILSKGSCQRGRKQNALEKAMAAFNRELRHNLHKTSLLCLLVQGLQMSSRCDDPLLQAKLFSLVPRELHYSAAEKLTKILKWFVTRKTHLVAAVANNNESSTKIEEEESSDVSGSRVSTVEMLVVVLRVIGLRARLVLVLSPIPFKPSRNEPQKEPPCTKDKVPSQQERREDRPLICPALPLGEPNREETQKNPLFTELSKQGSSDDKPPLQLTPSQPSALFHKLMQQLKQQTTTSENGTECCSTTTLSAMGIRGASCEETALASRRCKRKTARASRGNKAKKVKMSTTPDKGSVSCDKGGCGDVSRTGSSGKKGKRPVVKKAPTTICETSPYFSQDKAGSEEVSGSDSDSDCLPLKRKSNKRLFLASSDSDSEGDVSDGVSGVAGGGGDSEGKRKRRSKGKVVKGRLKKSQKSKVEQKKKTPQTGVYDETSSWAEVYSEDQKRYLCLHLPSCSIDQPKMCEKHFPHKISYIIAIDSRDERHYVSDVTARYASNWCTGTRSRRLSESWWREVLQLYAPSREEREREEDDIMNILYSHPMPTSINDYKSHPLYALRRHLLKFEAIYPVDSEILGYCKSEPVYSRSCVFTLHTRETWLKEGRVVKKEEQQPYKVVKARPKKGQSSLERETSVVEVFGRWQTEVYVPPPVIDGVVPRNEYGNVELFQPSMLPAGSRHIRIAGIHRVAQKLGVSYAPAMMGWDFHSGHCVPVIEGIVVAQENEEMMLEAWRQEEQLIIEKQIKKRESRVLERWKKLIRGVLIRERVQRTYSQIT